MIVCPSCATELPDGSRFCLSCGARLAAPAGAAEERKVVTTLFCDLVGFTAMSEGADPEDVDALLRAYHAAARKVIGSHGGVVEKFIGDAVVGVFGVPAAHEDDPERAVRAGLRLVEAVEGLTRPDGSPLEIRAGVNTGEALVRLDVQPGSGQGFLAGDAVNTAARLQAAAPPMGVLVGEATRELTEGIFEWRELAPERLKGKADPVRVWQAVAPLARVGAEALTGDAAPLVGRQGELAYLCALFDAAVSSCTPRFALLVGEPGIGKTRLAQELLAALDARPQMITWRQGRCLPYGEGVSFWALAQIVRAHCGIAEGSDEAAAQARVEAAIPAGPDHAWLADRVRALLGLDAPPATQEENFAGWLRFLESAVATRPAVLVFEDLHWADDALLGFLEYVGARLAEAPLMVIVTSRPEVFESGGPFAAMQGHVDRVVLRRLSQRETESLIDVLAGDSQLAGEVRDDIARRCGGNPLYAEQCVRLLADGAQSAGLPRSVQAVIAARLDALPQDEKTAAGDAAVVGATFWDGGLQALGGWSLEQTDGLIRALMARQLVRRARASAMSDEHEFVFAHALTQEVAYRQLPRAARARKHAAVARWLEAKAAGHPEDLADMVARHYSTAFDLAVTTGEDALAAEVRGPAARFLALAGDRAFEIDLLAAGKLYAAALDLVQESSPERARLESKLGEALLWSGSHREAVEHLKRAVDFLNEAGEVRQAAVTLVRLARARHSLGAGPGEVERSYRGALASLEEEGPCDELVTVLTEWGRELGNAGRLEESIAVFDRALGVSAELGRLEPPLALSLRGAMRAMLGDPRFLEDYRRALDLAQRQGLVIDRARMWSNYAGDIGFVEGPKRSLQEYERFFAFAAARGLSTTTEWARANRVEVLVRAGEWDEALLEAAEIAREFVSFAGSAADLAWMRFFTALLLAWRGEQGSARELLEQATVEAGEDVWDQDVLLATLVSAVVSAGADPDRECKSLEQMLVMMPAGRARWFVDLFPEAVRIALSGGDVALAERVRLRLGVALPVEQHALVVCTALLAEARGEHETAAAGFADAAARWHDFGVPYEEGHALLGQGRCLVALGRAPEAAAPLAAAREIFARLGARPALLETDAVLARLQAGGRA